MTITIHGGRDLGSAFASDIAATWGAYERFFAAHDLSPALVRDVALGALDRTAAWAPGLASEIGVVADGAGLERWQVAALNARSEVLARFRAPVPGECSTVVHLPSSGPPVTIQTWDWNQGMSDVKLIWQYSPRPGWTVKTFTEFGVLAKIGVNSAGLGLHFNLLQHDADGKSDGVPVHLVARRILDEAATVAEATEIARSAEVSASVALTVVTASEACTLELSPAGLARVPVGPDGFLLRTNHFLDPVLAQGERLGVSDPDTYARLRSLARRLPGLRSPHLADRAAALVEHREDGSALCCHPPVGAPVHSQWETLIVIALDVHHHRLTFQDGSPCTVEPHAWIRF